MNIQQRELKVLIQKSDNDEFVLPNFQRDYVWGVEQQKQLLSTFLVGLPTGNFLTLLGNSKDFSARAVCKNDTIVPTDNCIYLLDGQQRFSTLKNAFQNGYDESSANSWKENWNHIFRSLRFRYFLKVDDLSYDHFGYTNLLFDPVKFSNLEPSQVTDSIIEKKIQANNFKECFHPGFIAKDKQGKRVSDLIQRNNIIASLLAEQGLVPLYELYSITGGVPLHRKVLDKIASTRSEELKSEIAGNKKKLIHILSHVDENIEDYLTNGNEEKIMLSWLKLQTKWATEIYSYLEGLLAHKMLEIELLKSETARAFAIFQSINLPGTPLDEYDLIVAKAARNQKLSQLTIRLKEFLEKDVDLPDSLTYKINGKKPRVDDSATFGFIQDNVPSKDVKWRFLQLLSLIVHHQRYGKPATIDLTKREGILQLTEGDINSAYLEAITSVVRAFLFLRYRCGVKKVEELPYKLMLLPIAYNFIDDKSWNNKKVHDRIEFWYWSSLFSGHYRLDQNKRSFDDIFFLQSFIKEKNIDAASNVFSNRYNIVLDQPEYSDKTILLHKHPEFLIPGSLHKGILQWILSNQPYDFLEKSGKFERLTSWVTSSGESVLEDHHICPLYNASTIGISSQDIRSDKKHILNSILNRTYISKDSNRLLGSMAPDDYIDYISEPAKFNHCISLPVKDHFRKKPNETDEEYYERICSGRYEVLVQEIKKELLQLIDD
jgi:hypothetical protein